MDVFNTTTALFERQKVRKIKKRFLFAILISSLGKLKKKKTFLVYKEKFYIPVAPIWL